MEASESGLVILHLVSYMETSLVGTYFHNYFLPKVCQHVVLLDRLQEFLKCKWVSTCFLFCLPAAESSQELIPNTQIESSPHDLLAPFQTSSFPGTNFTESLLCDLMVIGMLLLAIRVLCILLPFNYVEVVFRPTLLWDPTQKLRKLIESIPRKAADMRSESQMAQLTTKVAKQRQITKPLEKVSQIICAEGFWIAPAAVVGLAVPEGEGRKNLWASFL